MPESPEDLEDRIAKARARGAGHAPGGQGTVPDAESGRALGVGLRIGIEFVSALVVGGGLGWVVGRWLGFVPAGVLIGLVLGFATGLLSVRRAMDATSGSAGKTSQATAVGSIADVKDTEEDDAEPS